MELNQHYEDEFNPLVRMTLRMQTGTTELHSRLTEDLDAQADIKRILEDSARAISQLIRNDVKRK